MVFDRSSINVGRTIQDFGLGDLSGVYRNTAKLRVKGWLVVTFFDPGAAGADTTAEILKSWYSNLPAAKVTILGVGIGDRPLLESFASKKQLDFPVVWDYEEYVSATWSVSATPTTYVTNASGIVVARIIGDDKPALQRAHDLIVSEIAKAEEAARVAAEKAASEKAAADTAAAAPAKV